MTKLIKIISAPLISLIFLLNMSSAGYAETTGISRGRVYI